MAAAATHLDPEAAQSLRKTPSAVDALITQARRPSASRSPRVGTDAVPVSQPQTIGPTATTNSDINAVPPTATTNDRFNVRSAQARSPRETAPVYAGQRATVTRLTAVAVPA